MSYITSYQPQSVTFTHGKGVWLWDKTGKQYLDGLSGIAVTGLGHSHPNITKAITEQAEKLLHTSNAYVIEHQEHLAEVLINKTGMQQLFMGNLHYDREPNRFLIDSHMSYEFLRE